MAEEPNVENNARGPSPEFTFPEPNPQEAMLFFNIIKNVSNLPDINWDNVATDSGFKNAAVAKKRFYQIKQKLGLDNNNLSGCSTSKPGRKPKATGSTFTSEAAQGAATSDTIRKPVASPKVTKRRKAVKTEKQGTAHAPKDGYSPTKTGVKTEDANF
ncbi:hypothetical protein CMQ_4606 [Grosmannia clavigera kw1407]|uniref:Myb-like DNA-binding domain-containing protein n=1 Tax=Grosmannia clavigera (strain kw1407 / UAMH 11150) TaxID=655863 RepID=F0XTG1_GROCL|nr:uncharacterized protein CMQ_4606 [Grosmannia clavigera kw1407]EFW98754.1 hypothetical protein CMQ_4606 [Grosmannia clavigera kw1407]